MNRFGDKNLVRRLILIRNIIYLY